MKNNSNHKKHLIPFVLFSTLLIVLLVGCSQKDNENLPTIDEFNQITTPEKNSNDVQKDNNDSTTLHIIDDVSSVGESSQGDDGKEQGNDMIRVVFAGIDDVTPKGSTQPVVRVYCDFTNLTDDPLSAFSVLHLKAYQGDVALQTVTTSDDVFENNLYKSIRKDITIRVATSFYYDPDGGDIRVEASNWSYETEDVLFKEFALSELGKVSEEPVSVKIENPTWERDYPSEGEFTYNVNVRINKETKKSNGKMLVTVDFFGAEGTNSMNEDFFLFVGSRAFQDGIEINSTTDITKKGIVREEHEDGTKNEGYRLTYEIEKISKSPVEFQVFSYTEADINENHFSRVFTE